MTRILWGEFLDDEKLNESDKIVTISAKRTKLEESDAIEEQKAPRKSVLVKIKTPLVTQTIEVMKQTEMLRSLIDTYSTKSGPSNYLLNPCQVIPEVDFPAENAADFVSDEKFNKPIWFIPPIDTRFARGLPYHYSHINFEVSKSSLRKAVCGQLRVAGYTDASDSALLLFSDAIEEFIKNFMQHIREVHFNSTETQTCATVENLEKAYFLMTNVSLIQVHNYWRNLLARNRSEIGEYKSVFQEYDKLMKESQNMQKEEFQEGNFRNIIEMPQPSESTVSVGHIQESNSDENVLLNLFESQTAAQDTN